MMQWERRCLCSSRDTGSVPRLGTPYATGWPKKKKKKKKCVYVCVASSMQKFPDLGSRLGHRISDEVLPYSTGNYIQSLVTEYDRG